jgi:hypothetical protein
MAVSLWKNNTLVIEFERILIKGNALFVGNILTGKGI